jgi:hypothetical protein
MSLLVSKLNAQLSKAAPGPLIAAASEKVLMAASTTSPGILTTIQSMAIIHAIHPYNRPDRMPPDFGNQFLVEL